MEETADFCVLGCGWLGLPLAERLVHAGHKVNGSTTSPDKMELLHQKGITPFLVNLGHEPVAREQLQSFLNARTLVFNIPPHLRADGGESYLRQMHLLLKALLNSPANRLLFVSSTAVYPDLNRTVTEEDIAFTDAATPLNMLRQAELLFQERDEWLTTVVRFGGLVGGSRHPGRFLAGKVNVPNGDGPVNMIHQDDCVAILTRIIELKAWGKEYNACAGLHPLRRDFYHQAAVAIGLTPPQFNDMEETNFKLIKSDKLIKELSYTFVHPDPMAFF